MPGISVVIPAYNAGRFIGDAIRSALAQTVVVREIIVVDDGSDDDTAAAVGGFGPAVRLLRCAHRGAAAARNDGVRAAAGPLLAFLDADDVWHPDKLERQLGVAGAAEGDAIVFGHCAEFSDPPGAFPVRAGILRAPSLSALLIARRTFVEIGFLDETLPLGELIEWLSRPAAARCAQAFPADALFDRRVHGTNATRSTPQRAETYLRILRNRGHAKRG